MRAATNGKNSASRRGIPPSSNRRKLEQTGTSVPLRDVTPVHSLPMSFPDELEQLVAAGLVTAEQAGGARRVDDDIAATAIGKLVCIGLDAKALLPGYAQTFGLTVASDEALARAARPPLPQPLVDALAALPGVPTWGADGTLEIVVTAARTVAELAPLGLPQHRVLVGDEPRVMALLDRVLEGPPTSSPPAPGPSAKSERFLARPVREVDRRGGLGDPSQSSIVIAPFGAPMGAMAAPFGAPSAPSAGPVDAPFASAPNPFANAVPNANARGAPNPFADDAAPAPFPSAPFPSSPFPSAAASAPTPNASLEIDAAAPRRAPSGGSGPNAAAPREAREVSREVARPEPKRSMPVAAIVGGVVVVAVLAVGGVMMMRNQAGNATLAAAADHRTAALDEARAKERAADFAWAIAGYSRAVDDPRRDDETADALLGRARCSIALGDREEALRDIETVTSGAFASPPMKQKAEALRASMQ